MKSAWIIAGNSACCKSYSIQEVLEAAQASQHFRSFFFSFLFSLFICLFQVSLSFFGFGFCFGFLFCFLFFVWFSFSWQSCVRASESLGNVFGDAYLILVPPCPLSVTICQPSPAPWLTAARDKPVHSHISWPLSLAVPLLQPVLVPVPFSRLCSGKEGKTLGSLPHRGVVRANQLTRLKCFHIIKHYNNYCHNYYWSTA